MATAKLAQPKFVSGRRVAGGLASELADLLRTLKALYDPYRPELHYMRGPGPKWHAKHAPAPVAQHRDHGTLVRVRAR
jgi:hypothetical protein